MIIINDVRNTFQCLSLVRYVDNAIGEEPATIITDPSKGSIAPIIKAITPMI